MALSWENFLPWKHFHILELVWGCHSFCIWSQSLFFNGHTETPGLFIKDGNFPLRIKNFDELFLVHGHRECFVYRILSIIFWRLLFFFHLSWISFQIFFFITALVTDHGWTSRRAIFLHYKEISECAFHLINDWHTLMLLSYLKVAALCITRNWRKRFHLFGLEGGTLEIFLVSILNFEECIPHRIFLPIFTLHIILQKWISYKSLKRS